MQKTTIQKAIASLVKRRQGYIEKPSSEQYITDIRISEIGSNIAILQSLLPAEQSQIEAAWLDGAYADDGTAASDYYLTTFTALDGDKTDNNG